MGQRHGVQHGTFHVTTNTAKKIPWLTADGIPEIILDNLWMTRNMHKAQVYAFCILPDHMHIILNPGERGLSVFMHSFKRVSSKDIRQFLGLRSRGSSTPADCINHYFARVNEPALRNLMHTFCLPGAVGKRGSNKYEPAFRNQYIGWHNGFHDERIRDADQRSTALAYVQGNAIKHRLVGDLLDWPWTSLHFQSHLDPIELWL